ncbi:sugar ABC transporter substrate-binding protein [Frondihabitans australicus]|uniref:Carbohydrate ABC transporter substrate-binding protein (CUT1 family) n=1 Tax=Frondihabitans australicus TaxID=386892 RepID=A0A495IM12_9MICO|nr:extracellular solute-binding protein [Frondihabitans australicus]RKR76206.1 carbohydrate ABC transporter substrate-binding protein (CUT1 family) [Frondihabitans australicus]
MQRRTPRTARRLFAAGALATATALALTACGSGFSSSSSTSGALSKDLTHKNTALSVLIGSSGPAETKAVTNAVADWSKSSGTKASVTAANNLDQQLAQGFASGKPADVFYVASSAVAGYAKAGDLLAYGDQLPNKSDFYPTLVKSFTVGSTFYCAPKDVSTLALVINTKMWSEAGLTSKDYPTTWAQLKTVAAKLTTKQHAGLVMSPQYERLGAFMQEAGGTITNSAGTEATIDSKQNAAGLTYVQDLLKSGSAQFSTDQGTGWGGESFGKGLAAMTVEGNWITGAMQTDYPNIDYKVVEMPAGPSGKSTMQFTNCWGIAKDSPNQKAALALVEKLTSKSDQLSFSKQFGVMPSIQSAATEWKQQNPALVPFLNSVSFAKGVPNQDGSADVVTAFDSKLASLKTENPSDLLSTFQKNFQAILQK